MSEALEDRCRYCNSGLRIHPYTDKAKEPQGAVVCPRCDGLTLWPGRKKRK